MNLRTSLADGLVSLATRLGTSEDKAMTASYATTLLTTEQIEAAFRSSWIIRKLVTIPAQDATRKWRQWSGDKTQEIEDLEDDRRITLRAKVAEAYWKARLFGGAAILIGTNDVDWSKPLVPAKAKEGTLRYLAVLTRHDLSAGLIEDDPRDLRFGLPRYYDITTSAKVDNGLFRIHPSRLVEFRGEPLPRWNTGGIGIYGWGDSVLQSVYEACRNLDATMANIASLVFEAKTDVVQIPGLTANISDPQFEQALLTRFGVARMLKGNHGTLILDAEEEHSTRAYTFSGLDAVADRFMQIAAGAADVPMTRLFGMSPGGLNSTGEGDLANYYDRLSSVQIEFESALALLDEVLVRSAGADWDEHTYEWRPLRQMTDEQLADLRGRNAETVAKLASSQIFSDEAVAALGAQLFQGTGVDALMNEDGEPALPEEEEEWDFSGEAAEFGLEETPVEGVPAEEVTDRRSFQDFNVNQPRWPKDVPIGGQWMDPQGGVALSIYQSVLAATAAKANLQAKTLQKAMLKAKKDPKLLTKNEVKAIAEVKKGLYAERVALQKTGAPTKGTAADIELTKANKALLKSKAKEAKEATPKEDFDLDGLDTPGTPASPKQTPAPSVEEQVASLEASKAALSSSTPGKPLTYEEAMGQAKFKKEFYSGGKSYEFSGDQHKAGLAGLSSPKELPKQNDQDSHLADGPIKARLKGKELQEVRNYTGNGYKGINASLRNDSPASPVVRSIDSAIAKAVLKDDITVVRGFAPSAIEHFAKGGKFAEGSVISDKGFLSASGSPYVAQSFSRGGYLGVITVRKGKTALPVESNQITKNSGEDEWILPRGAQLRIVRIDTANGIMELEML